MKIKIIQLLLLIKERKRTIGKDKVIIYSINFN